MAHAAKVLADSISPDGFRLTTLEVTFPRIVLAEKNTHRLFSRNSASSRAIPVERMIKMVQDDPYVPTHWGKNQKGMQADEEFPLADHARLVDRWLAAAQSATNHARLLLGEGVHKQITNRLLEPFMWHTALVTATEWSNWDHLRANKDAHPEIRKLAELMLEVRTMSRPEKLGRDQWHLPLVPDGPELLSTGYDMDALIRISIARCARVSYLTHDGRRDPSDDMKLFDRLLTSGHMSPLEHVARPMSELELDNYHRRIAIFADGTRMPIGYGTAGCVGNTLGGNEIEDIEDEYFCGNFQGWVQMRKLVPGESDVLSYRARAS